MWIEPGKRVTVGELEKGIVISSGNDATVAIAEHIAGSEEAFVALMNNYAEQLGLDATHFENTHGLPNPDHLTTARDLGVLAVATIRDHPERYKVYRELSYTYNDITQYNRNHLLREDPSVVAGWRLFWYMYPAPSTAASERPMTTPPPTDLPLLMTRAQSSLKSSSVVGLAVGFLVGTG